ncbi:hypothetical protein [Methylobacterium hispanicum]|uniref:hypothetical protein n=1 Tax=Methylobacterium hispanicum TaxID=270350 RepID=UPI002F2B91F0
MTFSNVTARRAEHAGTDRSVLVIAFMMALVFVPVLATHVAVLTLGSDISLSALKQGVRQVAKLSERAPG